MTRDELIQLRNVCATRLMVARNMGYSDDEILDGIRSGTKRDKEFADFLENEIMKKENDLCLT